MKISALTVSYLNELDQKVEWLHPFYCSLSDELCKTNEDVFINHYVALNDYDKVKAKENILSIKECYDYDSKYKLSFFSSDVLTDSLFFYPFDKYDSPQFSHTKALCYGIDTIKEKVRSNSDFFLIQEYDLIHLENYIENLLNYINFLEQESSYIGRILTGGSRDHSSLNATPRVIPCFFGVPPSLFQHFFCNFRFFDSSKVLEEEDSKTPINTLKDTGSEVFYRFLRKHDFFHASPKNNLFNHIKGVSTWFSKLIGKYEEKDFIKVKQKLNSRFQRVKNSRDLNFNGNTIFDKDEFTQNLEEVFNGNKVELFGLGK